MSAAIPNPIFILQNSKPITSLLFSAVKSEIIYAGNRNGDLTIYDVNLRRSLFSANPNKEAILSIIELDENTCLAYCRNGSVFKWNNISNTTLKCKNNRSKSIKYLFFISLIFNKHVSSSNHIIAFFF